MTDTHQKTEKKSVNSINPVIAGIAGAVAGGVAVAAAMVMSDKNNQKKIGKAVEGAKEKVTEYVDAIKTQPIVQKSAHKAVEVVDEAKKRTEKKV